MVIFILIGATIPPPIVVDPPSSITSPTLTLIERHVEGNKIPTQIDQYLDEEGEPVATEIKFFEGQTELLIDYIDNERLSNNTYNFDVYLDLSELRMWEIYAIAPPLTSNTINVYAPEGNFSIFLLLLLLRKFL